jgi:hypothetical protein
MKHPNWIAGIVVALGLAANAAAERAPSRLLEGAIETYTNEVTLPGSAGGAISVRHCERCNRALNTDGATLYYIGSRPATLAELNAYLRTARRLPLAIFYNLGDGRVSRVAAGK